MVLLIHYKTSDLNTGDNISDFFFPFSGGLSDSDPEWAGCAGLRRRVPGGPALHVRVPGMEIYEL